MTTASRARPILIVLGVVALVSVALLLWWWQQRPLDPVQQARAMLEQVLGPYGQVSFADATRTSDNHLLVTDVRYDLQHTPWRYEADELLIRHLDRQHDLPDVLDVSVTNLKISRQDGLPAYFVFDLQRLGLQQSKWNVDLNYVFHRRTGLWQIQGELGLSHAATLDFRARLDQVDKDAILFAWPTAMLKELHLRYQDQGLQDAVIRASAAEGGLQAELFILQLEDMLQHYAQSSIDPRQQANFEALRQWLQKSGNLQLSMQPPQPISLLELSGLPPERLADRLQLQIEHQP